MLLITRFVQLTVKRYAVDTSSVTLKRLRTVTF